MRDRRGDAARRRVLVLNDRQGTVVAKRFRFRLETLLNVRRLREEEAKRKVGAKSAEIARLDQLNEQTVREILAQQEALRGTQRQAAIDPGTLTRTRAWIAHLRRTIFERQTHKGRLLEELHELQDALRKARVQTRVIEKLRERRRDEHKRRADRQTEAEIEELAQQLLRHNAEHESELVAES